MSNRVKQSSSGAESIPITPSNLTDFVPVVGHYAKARPGVFPSKYSAHYFLRYHGQYLIDEGIGLKIGNKWSVIPERCDEYIIRVLQRDGGFRPRRSTCANVKNHAER